VKNAEKDDAKGHGLGSTIWNGCKVVLLRDTDIF
jgi:hypothetical protein